MDGWLFYVTFSDILAKKWRERASRPDSKFWSSVGHLHNDQLGFFNVSRLSGRPKISFNLLTIRSTPVHGSPTAWFEPRVKHAASCATTGFLSTIVLRRCQNGDFYLTVPIEISEMDYGPICMTKDRISKIRGPKCKNINSVQMETFIVCTRQTFQVQSLLRRADCTLSCWKKQWKIPGIPKLLIYCVK